MQRFVLGIGIGILAGVAGGATLYTLLTRASAGITGSVATPTRLFENERVKAWSLTLEPGQSTAKHTHELDEVVVCLEGSRLRITTSGSEPESETVHPSAGDVFMPPVKGVTHILTNIGATPYRQVSIELK